MTGLRWLRLISFTYKILSWRLLLNQLFFTEFETLDYDDDDINVFLFSQKTCDWQHSHFYTSIKTCENIEGFHKRTEVPILTPLSTLISHIFFHMSHRKLVNVKLDISGFKRITLLRCRFNWSCLFQITQLKWSWQYWRYCDVESMWKPLFAEFMDPIGWQKLR